MCAEPAQTVEERAVHELYNDLVSHKMDALLCKPLTGLAVVVEAAGGTVHAANAEAVGMYADSSTAADAVLEMVHSWSVEEDSGIDNCTEVRVLGELGDKDNDYLRPL